MYVCRWLKYGLAVLVASHVAKAVRRNCDWKDELSIYESGLRVNSANAKLFNNVGFAYQQQEAYEKALTFFEHATRFVDERSKHLISLSEQTGLNLDTALQKKRKRGRICVLLLA